jgi:hypothetical protein
MNNFCHGMEFPGPCMERNFRPTSSTFQRVADLKIHREKKTKKKFLPLAMNVYLLDEEEVLFMMIRDRNLKIEEHKDTK